MLKLLIVDDEPIIRKGIRRIIDWGRYGYEICGEAEDGPGAVGAILSERPDLVLMDIRLPGFSGLEVIRRIRAAGRGEERFLILSGYTDFDYAREAINLGALGYIVKPIEEELLIERIEAAARDIERERPSEQEVLERRQSRFLEILDGPSSRGLWATEDPSGEKAPDTAFFQGEYVQAAAVSAGGDSPEKGPGQRGRGGLIRAVRDFFTGSSSGVFLHGEFIIILFEDVPEAAVKNLLEKFYDFRRGKPRNDPSAPGPSLPVLTLGSRLRQNSLPPGDALRQSCREAEQLGWQIFFHRDKKYLSMDIAASRAENQGKTAKAAAGVRERARELCAHMELIDHEKIIRFFKDLEEEYLRSEKMPPEIRQECLELMIETRGSLSAAFPALRERLGDGREIFSAIMEKRCLGDIREALTEACLFISGSLSFLSADSSFQRIVSYGMNNYKEDLKLEALGRLFNYSPSYLGKRFKEHTGKSFHTWLDSLRIEAAKELLRTTSLKVYEISSLVGYVNTDYFYGKFKKYTGESPLMFRGK
jgi:two-component system response regulator YesN